MNLRSHLFIFIHVIDRNGSKKDYMISGCDLCLLQYCVTKNDRPKA